MFYRSQPLERAARDKQQHPGHEHIVSAAPEKCPASSSSAFEVDPRASVCDSGDEQQQQRLRGGDRSRAAARGAARLAGGGTALQ